jgi:hypothetical protein
MLDETQQNRVVDWADTTFGPTTIDSAYTRFFLEVVELQDHIFGPTRNPQRILEECADCLITLYRVAALANPRTSLLAAAEVKLGINKARKWDVNADGTGQHIKG